MAQRKIYIPEELTEDSMALWEMIGASTKEKEIPVEVSFEQPAPIELNLFKIEVEHLRLELRKIVKNSQQVIEQCDKMLSLMVNAEEYKRSDAKVAKTLHSNLIKRVTRVLDGDKAFDKDIMIEAEPKRPYDMT